MNIVKCISGLKGEGKTDELLEGYLNTNKLGLGINAVFFTCEQPIDGVFKQLSQIQDKIVELDNLKDQRDITFDKYKLVACKDEDELFIVMKSHVEEYDCNLYIDDPHTLSKNFTTKVESFVDSYPCENVKNSVDVTYTRLREK